MSADTNVSDDWVRLDVATLRLAEGDVIVLYSPRSVSTELGMAVAQNVREKTGHPCLIVGPGVEVGQMTQDEVTAFAAMVEAARQGAA